MVEVLVQPRAKRSEVIGLHGNAIKIRLRAPPVDGAANEELLELLRRLLGLGRGAVELVAGHGSRRKRVRVNGLGTEEIRRILGLEP